MSHKSGQSYHWSKVKIDITLLKFSSTTIVTWDYLVDEPAKGRYDIILGRDLLA